jgi:hypothetical protein
MKLILTQMVRLLGALLVLYGVLLATTLGLVPRADVGQRLDSGRAGSSLYMTEPKYVFLARSQLNSPADKVLLLGASNMLIGFKQPQVQALMPGVEVHNLSVGASNVTQLSQIVDLVREVQTPEARRHNTYVIGLWYGLFADDKVRWHTPDRHAGDTDIDIERYRYGLYLRTDTGPVSLLPAQHLDAGVLLIHPYLVLDRCARDLTRSLRSFMAAKPPLLSDEQRNAVVVSDAQRREHLERVRGYMGSASTLGDAPFHALEQMVDAILAEGGRVVLVDMAIPQWHAQGSVLSAEYQQRVHQLLTHLQTRAGVAVLTMDDARADDDFIDDVHPKPRVTGRWAQRLAAVLHGSSALALTQAAMTR